MTLWIVLLRAVGTLVFLFGLIGNAVRLLLDASSPIASQYYVSPTALLNESGMLVGYLALSILCFAAAAGLRQIDRVEQRFIALSTRRRARVAPQARQAQPAPVQPIQQYSPPVRDLAPVAPNWDDLPEPVPYLDYLDRSVARHKRTGLTDEALRATPRSTPTPTVRPAPPPARTTPGMEYQYGDLTPAPPPPMSQATRPAHYVGLDDVVVDRDTLRRARDKQIRRAQAENIRKPNNR